MRKTKIEKIPMYTDIHAGERLWTPDGVIIAPMQSRRYVMLDCRDRQDKHLRFEFVPLADYMKRPDAVIYNIFREVEMWADAVQIEEVAL